MYIFRCNDALTQNISCLRHDFLPLNIFKKKLYCLVIELKQDILHIGHKTILLPAFALKLYLLDRDVR